MMQRTLSNRRLRTSFTRSLFIAVSCAGLIFARAETNPKFYAVEASAEVQSVPARITLSWPADGNATGYTVYRKSAESASWGAGTSLSGGATSYTDNSVAAGVAYEYQIAKTTTLGYRGYGYVLAGIEVPLADTRGKVILVVDNTHAAALTTELARLQQDLVGDGWTVLRRDVSRNDSVASVKNVIKSAYASDPANVKAVFLFGRVPVPYSGNFNPDGHPDHQGAWPADAFYGDMDGNWTDSSVSTTSAERPRNHNVPGDGKYDQTDLPSDIELQVGRVDLSSMTCFSNKTPSRSELDLLRQYLNKHHNFRHRLLNVERRGLICDNFGERDGEAFAASGWRNFSGFFGAANVTQVPGWSYFSNVGARSYLWSYGCGGGSWYTCDGIGSSDDFAQTDVQSVFTMFLGSYFGDWDNESNFLRAPLGSTSYTLASAWAGRPHWFFHHMALGQTIGYGTRLSQNNGFGGLYQGQNYGSRQAHVALMGDPTLRMHPVAPPSNLRAASIAAGVVLTWDAALDANLRGYHVYRAATADGPFMRLTSSAPIALTTFTDSTANGSYVYQVRAVKLEQSASGTYLNASQGIFSAGSGSGGTGGTVTAPTAPGGLTAALAGTQANLVWADNSANESGFKIERRTTGSFAQIATVAANAASYSDTGLSAGTTYTYRLRSYNSAGDSAYSSETSVTTAASGSATTSAAFVSLDTTTRGGWKGVYGTEGAVIVGDTANYPSYAQVAASGKSDWVWAWSSSDARALNKAGGSDRLAACWYGTTFTFDVNLTDANTHRVALYCLDWDTTARSQKIEVLDAQSGAVLNTQTLAGFNGGQYLVWDLKGKVRFRFTRLSGFNAVVSGLFFGAGAATPSAVATPTVTPAGGTFAAPVAVTLASATAGAIIRYTLNGSTPTAASPVYSTPFIVSSSAVVKASATKSGMADSGAASASFVINTSTGSGQAQAVFVTTDTTTKGSWKGVYGADGYQIVYDATVLPAYAQLSRSGDTSYLWNDRSTDPRALEHSAATGLRTAACWYAPSSLSVEVNLTDGRTHRLALYCLDWDTTSRAQTIEVIDAVSGAVVNTQTVSGFNGGKYFVWDVKGQVRFRLTRIQGNNAVLMGVFFDESPAQLSVTGGAGGAIDSGIRLAAVPQRLTDGTMQVQLQGAAGQTLLLEASSDLKTWSAISTNILSSSSMEVRDSATSSAGMRFYRASLVQ